MHARAKQMEGTLDSSGAMVGIGQVSRAVFVHGAASLSFLQVGLCLNVVCWLRECAIPTVYKFNTSSICSLVGNLFYSVITCTLLMRIYEGFHALTYCVMTFSSYIMSLN